MEKQELQEIARLLGLHLDSTKVWPDGKIIHIRRRVASVGDLQIHVRPHDHDPPHFHVISIQRGIDARFDLTTLTLISMKQGRIFRDDEKKVRDFFLHRPENLAFLRSEHERLATISK